MTKPFKGIINLDSRDSVPDWEPYDQPKAPGGAPNLLYIVWDDVGFGAWEMFGRTRRFRAWSSSGSMRPCSLPMMSRCATASRNWRVPPIPHSGPVLLDMEASNNLDLSSVVMLAELVTELKAEVVVLLLANVRTPIRDVLDRSGVAQTIGEEHIYLSNEEGVEDFGAQVLAQN